jgi:hypothetical protein
LSRRELEGVLAAAVGETVTGLHGGGVRACGVDCAAPRAAPSRAWAALPSGRWQPLHPGPYAQRKEAGVEVLKPRTSAAAHCALMA